MDLVALGVVDKMGVVMFSHAVLFAQTIKHPLVSIPGHTPATLIM